MEQRPPPARMDDLAVLPIFLKLEGKRAILAGGTVPAVWKAELLSAAGAAVEVFDPAPCADLVSLAAQPPRGTITLVPRVWTAADLEHAAIAIGAIEEEYEALAFQEAARRLGVPVNVIDKPVFCDFQFGTIVNRSPLVIGISTDGAAPVFGQAVRTLIEALLPQELKRWAEAARVWRPTVQNLGLGFRARRRFWEAFTTRALASDAVPTEADRDAFLALVSAEDRAPEPGMVTLVGAGPAGSDEVTLGAVRALQSVDVLFYAEGLPESTINLSRREALKSAVSSTDLITELVVACGPGRKAAWLDRGNPLQCRRWKSRANLLEAAGLRVDLIAGLGLCEDCGVGCPAWRPDAGP